MVMMEKSPTTVAPRDVDLPCPSSSLLGLLWSKPQGRSSALFSRDGATVLWARRQAVVVVRVVQGGSGGAYRVSVRKQSKAPFDTFSFLCVHRRRWERLRLMGPTTHPHMDVG